MIMPIAAMDWVMVPFLMMVAITVPVQFIGPMGSYE
jgi:hypothetical protein